MVSDSIINALLSIEKRFDEYDAARPSSAPAADPTATAAPPTPTLGSRATHDLDDLGDFAGDASSSDDDEADSDDDEAASGED